MPPATVCSADCPDAAHLRQLLAEGLNPQQEDELVRHLDSCTSCQVQLEALARDSATLPLPGAADEHPPASSAFWPALERLERLALSATTPMSAVAAADDVSLSFLAPPDEPGYLGKLGKFEVASVIGRGGMGVVLRAFDPCLQRYVAIKVLDPELAKDEIARKRFCREIRAAAAVTHENVVAVYEVVREEEKDIPFLVMQLVTGSSLEDRLRRVGRLPLRDVLRIGLQTAAGLAAAHAQGLIHRDIKPANILLETGTDRVKVTDFGLAKAVEDVKLTGTGFIAGTPLYMAPEQARGEPVDHRADLFSLGSVLYELCTGQPPFDGNTPYLVLRRVTEEVPKPIRDINPDVPDELVAVIDKLHAKKPEDRFASATEVAEILTELLMRLPSVRPASQSDMRRRWGAWGLRPLLPFVTGLVLGIGLGVLGDFAWRTQGSDVKPTAMLASDAASPKSRAVLTGNAGPVWSVAFTPDAQTVAMAIDDGTVKLWDAKSASVRSTLNAHLGPVWSVALSRDGGRMATASDDGIVKVWDTHTWKEQAELKHRNAIRALAFAPDGKRLVAGSRDGSVLIWEVSASDTPVTTAGHKGTVVSVAFSADGKAVASAGGDKLVKLWDAETGQERLTFQGHTGGVYAVAFASDNKTLASGGWDRTVRLWESGSGNNVATLQGHGKDVWTVAFAPDGKTLVSAGEDQTVKLWDVASGRELITWKGHESAVYSVAFSQDGKTVASGGRDGTVRLWDVPAGR
jgi:tricorn protease-like protein